MVVSFRAKPSIDSLEQISVWGTKNHRIPAVALLTNPSKTSLCFSRSFYFYDLGPDLGFYFIRQFGIIV